MRRRKKVREQGLRNWELVIGELGGATKKRKQIEPHKAQRHIEGSHRTDI